MDMLNLKRIRRLQNKGVSKQVYKFRVGNYVLLRGLTKTVGGSKSNVSPKFRDVFKVTQLMNNGFGLKILNLRTGSLQSCSHEKIRLLTLGDLVAANISTRSFWNMPDLLSRRGYFRTGKSKVRLNLLEDDSNCTDGVLESDCEQPLVEGAQTTETGGNTEAGSVSMDITQPLELQEQEPVLTDQEQNEVDQENDLMALYSAEDQDISEITSNSQGSLEQGEVNTDQDQSEVLPEVLNQINPDNRNFRRCTLGNKI